MQTEANPTKQVRLAGALFNRSRHICAFFNSREEEYRVMLPFIKEGFKEGHEQGYKSTRFIANMEWALEGKPGIEKLVAYETRFNYILPKYEKNTVCCTYDVARFGASIVMDMLRTHPMVIVGGSLQENPFWVPPDEFLEELRQRSEPTSVQY